MSWYDGFNNFQNSLSSDLSSFGTGLYNAAHSKYAQPFIKSAAHFAPRAGKYLGGAGGALLGSLGGPQGTAAGAFLGSELGDYAGKWAGHRLKDMTRPHTSNPTQSQYPQSSGLSSYIPNNLPQIGSMAGYHFGNFLDRQLPSNYQGRPVNEMARTFGQDVGSRLGGMAPAGMEWATPLASDFLGDQFSSMVPSEYSSMGLGELGGAAGNYLGTGLSNYLRGQTSQQSPQRMPFSQRSPLPTLSGMPRLSEMSEMYSPMVA